MSTASPARTQHAFHLAQQAITHLFPNGASRHNDLGGIQTVTSYQTPTTQRQYVHMYLAKHLAVWRKLRRILNGKQGPLVSIGAGPWLDAMGWCWDHPWNNTITLVDPLPWEAVTGTQPWQQLGTHLIGGATRHTQRYIPEIAVLPQLANIPGLTPFPAASIPDGATVLMPFVLNHFRTGTSQDVLAIAALARWLKTVTARNCRVVIVDMYHGTDAVWWPFLRALGIDHLPASFQFQNELQALQGLYQDGLASYRSYQHRPDLSNVRVLVFDRRWITQLE